MSSTEKSEHAADNLSEKQRRILRTFELGEKLNTRDLTRETGYTNQTVGHHMKQTLIEDGLVENIGRDESTKHPRSPLRYKLTEWGEAVLTVFRQRRAKTEADISRVDELSVTVERLETENEELRSRLSDTEEQLEKHRNAIKYIQDQTGIE